MSTHHARPDRPHLNKALGQHLLVSDGVLDDIVRVAELSADDVVVEVGPGTGLLTRKLLDVTGHVIAVEIDPAMVAYLQEALPERRNLTLIVGDIREERPWERVGSNGYIVVANLPYFIASTTIRRFLESSDPPRHMVVLVQREVAQQMVALPGRASLLTLATQVYADARIVRRVKPGSFVPAPGVESAVVRLDISPEPRVPPHLIPQFFTVARAGFSAPRKQLRNSLSNGLAQKPDFADTLLATAQIDGRRRAETLTIQEWSFLTEAFNQESLRTGSDGT